MFFLIISNIYLIIILLYFKISPLGSYKTPEFGTKDNLGQNWSSFSVSAGGSLAPSRVYKRPSFITGLKSNNPQTQKPRIHSLYTAIISLDMGVITGVTWDDGCYGCAFTALDNGCDSSIVKTNATA